MISEKRKEELENCQKILGHYFKNIKLLNQALTHKSFVNENERKFKDNERLEFLGDSVLDLIIGEYALKKFTTHMGGGIIPFIRRDLSRFFPKTKPKIKKFRQLGQS